MGSRMLSLLYPLFLSSFASQVATAPNFWSQLWSLRDQQDQRALRTKAFTWTPAPAAPDTGKGSSDQAMIPTGGDVAQFARAGEGLNGAQPDFDARPEEGLSGALPDFDDFFHHGAEEEESVAGEENPTVSQNMRGV